MSQAVPTHICYHPTGYEPKRKGKRYDRQRNEREVALITKPDTNLTKDEIWAADSGASKHMTGDPEGMFDLVEMNEHVVTGNDGRLICKEKGKLKIIIWINEMKEVTAVLEEVLCVPGIRANLFRLSNVTKKKQIEVHIEGNEVKLRGPTWAPWRIFMRSKEETLYEMKCKRTHSDTAYMTNLTQWT